MKGVEVFVVVGLGMINDLCKYVIFFDGCFYSVFGMVLLMNGYMFFIVLIMFCLGLKIMCKVYVVKGVFIDIDVLVVVL